MGSPEDIESLNVIETEVLADLPESMSIKSKVTRCDVPERLPLHEDGIWVYRRREPCGES
jgi:hypothetical protein